MFMCVANPREVANLPLPSASPACYIPERDILADMLLSRPSWDSRQEIIPEPVTMTGMGSWVITEELLRGRRRLSLPFPIPTWMQGTISYRPAPGSGFEVSFGTRRIEFRSRVAIQWEAVDADNIPGLLSGTIIGMRRI